MAMLEGSGSHKSYWQTQKPIDYLDTTLTINTPETVVADLSGGRPAKIWFFIVEQTNNGAAVETLVVHITINGTVYDVTLTGVASGAQSYISCYTDLATGDFNFNDSAAGTYTMGSPGKANLAIPFTARSIGLITVEQTSAVDGVSAQIEVNIVWEKLVQL